MNESHDPLSPSSHDAAYPTWPKPIGITSIVWGSLGLLCNGCGIVGILMQSTFLQSAEQQLGPMPDVMKPPPGQVPLIAVGIVWTFLLLISGILLISRKQVSLTLHLVYGIGGIVLGLAGTFIGVRQNLAISQWVQQNPADKWAQQSKPELGWAILVIAVILGLAWPIFCCIWFGMKRKTDLGGRSLSEMV